LPGGKQCQIKRITNHGKHLTIQATTNKVGLGLGLGLKMMMTESPENKLQKRCQPQLRFFSKQEPLKKGHAHFCTSP
jgi:hypothetical protein